MRESECNKIQAPFKFEENIDIKPYASDIYDLKLKCYKYILVCMRLVYYNDFFTYLNIEIYDMTWWWNSNDMDIRLGNELLVIQHL